LSPWLAASKPGDIYSLPVSISEGRFSANEAALENLAQTGQVATQYVDLSDKPTNDIRFNPGGAKSAIEGLTSPDGRVFGRTGHPERNAPGLYQNVPGNYDDKTLESGIAYFK
jgi:phosphoribosylformylglycinamidine synthase